MVVDLATTVDPSSQEVRFDGEIVRPAPRVYWWVHKPPGVLCTSKDVHGRRTILDLVPRADQRLFCVGRLDEESTGLVLVTNDGELAARLTHPRYQTPTSYEVLVAGQVGSDALAKIRRGVWTSDGKIRAHEARIVGTKGNATRLWLVLSGGHNREVRRMLAGLGHKVMRLARVGIGDVRLRKLPLGEARPATPEELAILRGEPKGRVPAAQRRGRSAPGRVPPPADRRGDKRRGRRGGPSEHGQGPKRPAAGIPPRRPRKPSNRSRKGS